MRIPGKQYATPSFNQQYVGSENENRRQGDPRPLELEVAKAGSDLVPLTDERASREEQNGRCENPLGYPEKVTTRYRQALAGKSRRSGALPIQAQTSRVRKDGQPCPAVRRVRRAKADRRGSSPKKRDRQAARASRSSRAGSHRGAHLNQRRRLASRKGALRLR